MKPTVADIATDLKRSIYATYSKENFQSQNFITFFSHAQELYIKARRNIDHQRRDQIEKCLDKVTDTRLSLNQRREHLLQASTLLMFSY